MAVNKVVPKAAKAHGGMRNQIEYVLKDEKVREGYVEITGPFNYDSVNWDTVYNAFLEEKRLWDKDSGRMCAHNIISFHKDENVSPAEVLEIGEAYAERFFPDHQNLIVVHQDKDHLHCHIITNTVSFIDGHKLHQNKRDLERQKAFTNELCREKGLSVTEKGRHFDGSLIEEGHVISWNKNKYQALLHDNGHTEKSYLIDCASAVLEAKETSMSKEEFICCMERAGWKTTWTDKRKNITFEDSEGHKVRNTNLEKTFHLDLGKEALLNEFERQKAEREREERERSEQARERAQYYDELSNIGSGIDPEAEGSNLGSQITASEERLRESEATVRTAEKGRQFSESKRRQSETKRRDRDIERKNQSVKQERSGVKKMQRDKGIGR